MHIKAAWNVLRNGLPEPVKETLLLPIVGEAMEATLYAFEYGTYERTYTSSLNLSHLRPMHYFLTCEQAHEAANGANVRQVKCIQIGATYFPIAYLGNGITVEPRPKVAKGRAK